MTATAARISDFDDRKRFARVIEETEVLPGVAAPADLRAIARVRHQVAIDHNAVPLRIVDVGLDEVLVVAISPDKLIEGRLDPVTHAALREASRTDAIKAVAVPLPQIRNWQREWYRKPTSREGLSTIANLVRDVIEAAEAVGASEMSVEPLAPSGGQVGAGNLRAPGRVRVRVVGNMLPLSSFPRSDGRVLGELSAAEYDPFVREVLSMAHGTNMDAQRTTDAQGGQFTYELPHRTLQLRVGAMPTRVNQGYTLGIRFHDENLVAATPEKLGMRRIMADVARAVFARDSTGTVCVGPTESGKTTLLSSLVAEREVEPIKIGMAADPVEIPMYGVLQVQLTDELDGPETARGFVRQSCDIEILSESRDKESAHALFDTFSRGRTAGGTIHAGDAATAIARFIEEFGIHPHYLSNNLSLVIGQRLIARLCRDCRRREPASALTRAEQRELRAIQSAAGLGGMREVRKNFVWRATGCRLCGNRGYQRRFGIYEVLRLTRNVRDVINGGTIAADKIADAAARDGYQPMIRDAYLRMLNGETSFEQLRRLPLGRFA